MIKKVLSGQKIINIGTNLPAPLAASKLTEMGALVIKIEPPSEDPLQNICPDWYQLLIAGQKVIKLDLKTKSGLKHLHQHLEESDLFLSSSRLSALERMGVDWNSLHQSYPNLCMVSIIGFSPPNEELAGHDLTYQASANLVTPPQLPRSLYADLFGAERTVQAILGCLLHRNIHNQSIYRIVTLEDSIKDLGLPFNFGLTTPHGFLGGASLRYNLYKTMDGWIALAALENKFWTKLINILDLDISDITKENLDVVFLQKTSDDWAVLGKRFDLPISKIN